MITKAYIHEYGNNAIEPEHVGVMETLTSRGIECELFTSKKLSRNQLQLNDSTLVVGDHPTLQTVFKRIGFTPVNDCYPESLRPFLNRKIRTTTIRKLLREYPNEQTVHIFVKPKSATKLFSGFVVHSAEDLYILNGLAKETEVYCSPVVNWLAEYRVFVNRSVIVGIKRYAGDERILVDKEVVIRAIRALEESTHGTSAYGIDFGVLEDGTTALVEWNDGYALGAYNLEREIYTDLILTRWNEIMESRSQSGTPAASINRTL